MQSVMMAVRQPVKLKIVLLYVPVVDGLFQGLMKRVQLYAGMVCWEAVKIVTMLM
jgi:hypothetical protein